jgi:hypothetical protein
MDRFLAPEKQRTFICGLLQLTQYRHTFIKFFTQVYSSPHLRLNSMAGTFWLYVQEVHVVSFEEFFV